MSQCLNPWFKRVNFINSNTPVAADPETAAVVSTLRLDVVGAGYDVAGRLVGNPFDTADAFVH